MKSPPPALVQVEPLALEHALKAIVVAIARELAPLLAAPPPPARIPLAEVEAHGAPSRRWVVDRARAKKIETRGPKGARFVLAADLEALLASETIARRPRRELAAPAPAQSVNAAVTALARRRASKAAA